MAIPKPQLTDEDYIAAGLNPPAKEERSAIQWPARTAQAVARTASRNHDITIFVFGAIFGVAVHALAHLF